MSSSSNRQKPAMAQHARAADPGKRKRSLGVTLIEAMAAIGVMAGATVGLVTLVDKAMDNTRAHATAQHMNTVGQAAQLYIRDHFAAVAAAAGPGPAALRIDISTLIGAGHLPPGFSSTNPKGQTLCVAVIEPVANQLHAVVLAQGGQAIDDVTLGQIAGSVGGSGGAVYAATPAVMRGTMGGWERAVGAFTGACAPQVSRPVKALWFTDGAANAALMRDAIPGNPAMNTMNTPILMGTGAVVTLGGTCPTPGAVARTSDGLALSCFGGVWQSSDTCRGIAAGTDLNGLTIPAGTQSCVNGHGLGNAPTADWFFVEIIRHTNPGNFYVMQRATGMTGAAAGRVWTRNQQSGAWSAWRAVGVDHLGNLNAPGTVTAGVVNAGSANISGALGAGTVNAGQVNANVLHVPGQLWVDTAQVWAGGVSMSAGNLAVPGTATINRLAGNLEVARVVAANTGCWPNGSLARDGVGVLLSCQSGVWRMASGGDTGIQMGGFPTGCSSWVPSCTRRVTFPRPFIGTPIVIPTTRRAYNGPCHDVNSLPRLISVTPTHFDIFLPSRSSFTGWGFAGCDFFTYQVDWIAGMQSR